MDNNPRLTPIGILYPGEMGASFGRLLREAGYPVVTAVRGRSLRTARLCHDAGLAVADSLGEVIDASQLLISLVSPAAAIAVAKDVAAHKDSGDRRLLYLDANSVSPNTVAEISKVLQAASIDLVDGAIFGLASRLESAGTLYLSGNRSAELFDLLHPVLRVKQVGNTPGRASALKMIVSALPKGLSAFFLEAMLLARSLGLSREAMDACNEIYPGIMEIMSRMLPTYPQHAARRSEELREVEETMLSNGVNPRVVSGARELTSDLAMLDWAGETDPQQWTIARLVDALHVDGMSQIPVRETIVQSGSRSDIGH